MSEETRSIEVCVVGAGGLWLAGFALLAWHTLGGPHAAAPWALMVTAMAAVWTIVIGQTKSRRRLVSGIQREIALARLGNDDDGLRPVR